MPDQGCAVIVGGTSGLGLKLAQTLQDRGDEVGITGRDPDGGQTPAKQSGGRTRGLAVALATPNEIAGRLADVGPVKSLVITAIERGDNNVRNFEITRAARLV